jgi:general nucleoside transport system permease protein
VLLSDEELAQQEIEAAKEREAEAQKVALEASFSQRLVAALTGTSVIVTLLAFVAAFVLGAFIIAFSEEIGPRGDDLLLQPSRATPSSPPGTRSAPPTRPDPRLARRDLAAVGDADRRHPADPHRSRRRRPAARRAVQHRRGGPGRRRGRVRRVRRLQPRRLPLASTSPRDPRRDAGGALYGWIPGILKARTGAHEVISTIMLNNIALLVSAWLVSTTLFRQPDRTDPISKTVEASARFPRFVPELRVNTSLLFALLLAAFIFWMVERSTRGFELNAVGLNPNAATTAGMSVNRSIILAMTTGRALGGAAGSR